MYTIEVAPEYGYVIATCLGGPFIANLAMNFGVGTARKKYNIEYPNLYATPGYHKNADDFNRVQRGHQHFFEEVTLFIPMALVTGLRYPITVSIYGAIFSIGSYLYYVGYADDSKDVKTARYTKGGPIKTISLLGTFGAVIAMSGSVAGWW